MIIVLPGLSKGAITLEVNDSTSSPVTVFNGVSVTLEAEVSSCPSGNYFYEVWYFKSGGGGSCTGGGNVTIISETNPPATSCSTESSTTYAFTSNGRKTLCYGIKACNNQSSCTQPGLNQLDETGSIGVFVQNAPVGISFFTITHDGYGINCIGETITVTAKNAGGATLTNFNGTVTLDTQTGTGNWTLSSGNGTFNDATANDGIATYTFDTANDGVASFILDYREGSNDFDIDVYLSSDTSIRDDDTEGNISFSPSGFTVTATALSNPPPSPINDPVMAQVAGTTFPLYLTAYGQNPSDPVCGIIEAYTGDKPLKFWSSYIDPTPSNTAGTQVIIDNTAIATTETVSTNQLVTFNNGQAQVNAKYKDVGQITISMKDDSVLDPELPNGIRGATNAFVVKPAFFTLSNIVRSSDGLANPEAADETGLAFIKAGKNFSVTVTAKDSEGDTTLSYGMESSPETVSLISNLIAPSGGNNPPLAFTNGFGSFTNGISTGNDFNWTEVGIITLNPGVGDNDYLGAGNVSDTVSANIGRFTPAYFDVNSTEACNSGPTNFTYSGQAFTVNVTARNIAGAITKNYDGVFTKDPLISNAGDSTNFTNNILTDTYFIQGLGIRNDVTYTFPVKDTEALSITNLRATDSDTVSSNGYIEGHNLIRSGRLAFDNAYGSELIDLSVPMRSEFYTTNDGYITNIDDSCSAAITLSLLNPSNTLIVGDGSLRGETCVLDTGSPGISTVGCSTAGSVSKQYTGIANAGLYTLFLKAPDSSETYDSDSPIYGSVTVQTAIPIYLQYDWDGDGNHDNAPDTIATFGLYRGDDRVIHWREVF